MCPRVDKNDPVTKVIGKLCSNSDFCHVLIEHCFKTDVCCGEKRIYLNEQFNIPDDLLVVNITS